MGHINTIEIKSIEVYKECVGHPFKFPMSVSCKKIKKTSKRKALWLIRFKNISAN